MLETGLSETCCWVNILQDRNSHENQIVTWVQRAGHWLFWCVFLCCQLALQYPGHSGGLDSRWVLLSVVLRHLGQRVTYGLLLLGLAVSRLWQLALNPADLSQAAAQPCAWRQAVGMCHEDGPSVGFHGRRNRSAERLWCHPYFPSGISGGAFMYETTKASAFTLYAASMIKATCDLFFFC